MAAYRLLFFCLNLMIPYLVCEFDKSTLSNLVKECFGSDFPDIFRKRQIDYIYRYLKDLGAESILLEFSYLDKDYLEDYSRYYVKRFSSSGNKCARLHFFSTKVIHSVIDERLVKGPASDNCSLIENAYLGFVVIKPLPKTFIGKTCLKHYEGMNVSSGHKKLLVRNYDVDLFGIKLSVNSVAFQEQDRVVSACATTAIWSALHAMSDRPIRDIPACSEITTNAINHIQGSSNSFPSKELSNKQIMRALDVERLRNHYEVLDSVNQEHFFYAVKCHIDSGLPLILGVEVFAVQNEKKLQLLAGHAVTVVGYKSSPDGNAIYLHDDRLGPFARATFIPLSAYTINGQDLASRWALVLQEKDDDGEWKQAHEVLLPTNWIVSTPQKVRLGYSFAKTTCAFIRDEYETWLDEISATEHKGKIDFSLKLSEISKIRQEVIACVNPAQKIAAVDLDEPTDESASYEIEKVRFLTQSYARYHWVARFSFDGTPAFRILFDATDIPQGNAVAGLFIENIKYADAILEIFRSYAPHGFNLAEPQTENFYVSFLKRLKKPEPSINEHLNKSFGALRAPSYLKIDETKNGNVATNDTRRQYYDATSKTLDEEFPEVTCDDSAPLMIWAIAQDGSLLIGKELDQIGHPGLTGFKPARIAGELKKTPSGWLINSKSGRYSKDYYNSGELLDNALEKFKTLFYNSRNNIRAEHWKGACSLLIPKPW